MNFRRLAIFSALVSTVLVKEASTQTFDTVSVYFALNERTGFDRSAVDALLKTFTQPGNMQIIGYADYLGSDVYNMQLSEDRARAVAQYINASANKNISVTSVSGAGELAATQPENAGGDPGSRRVDLVIEKKETVKTKPAEAVRPAMKEPARRKETAMEEPPAAKAFEIDTASNENIVLKGLSFIPGRHFPLPESRQELERLLLTMKEHPKLKIEIQGHICCEYEKFDGMDEDTQEPRLSENRAKWVYEFLVESGIDRDRMSYKGYGSSQPKVFPELTEADQQANRRVEIKIIKD